MKNLTKDSLNELAELCAETTGASFQITRLKDRSWKIYFVNTAKLGAITNKDIDALALEAISAVKSARVPIETETKYTLYTS